MADFERADVKMKKKMFIALLTATCILSACGRQESFTDDELRKEAAAVEGYLAGKYPEHEFDVRVEESVHGGTGLPEYIDMDRYATDENGVEFNVYYSFDQDDPVMFQLFLKHYSDNYEKKRRQVWEQ